MKMARQLILAPILFCAMLLIVVGKVIMGLGRNAGGVEQVSSSYARKVAEHIARRVLEANPGLSEEGLADVIERAIKEMISK